MTFLEKNKEATPRFSKQIVPAGKISLIVNAMLQRINIAYTFLEKNKEATPRFAKQIVPAGKISLIVNATLQRFNIA
jgi:hypothetical protein